MCGAKFRRQTPKLAHYILDFYCPRLKLAIEIDGLTHDAKRQQKNDKHRDAVLLSECGITTMRFKNEEVRLALPSVLQRIRAVVRERQRYA